MFFQSRARGTMGVLLLLVFASCIGMALLAAGRRSALYAAPLAEATASVTNADGTIAYVAGNGAEIRLIEADGSNDRLLWQAPNPELHQITSVRWSPDGTQLAFASDHESICSLYRSDIYTIQPDGANLRRVTNGPACAELANYPKGSVTIDVENGLSESIFLLYIEGAANAVELPIGSGVRQRITVDNVADFGDGVQQRVVVFQTEQNTWLHASAKVDVLPNSTAVAGEFLIRDSSVFLGAYSPSWQRDSSAIAYTLGEAGIYLTSANPGIGKQGELLFPGSSIFARTVALSPVDEQFLSYSFPFVSMGTVGDAESVGPILELTGTLRGLDWLADGSGMVAGELLGLGNTHANIWRYNFGASEVLNLTDYSDEVTGYAGEPSVSPDGAAVVYIYAANSSAETELMIMDLDGSNVHSLGVVGLHPDWGVASQNIPNTPTPVPTSSPTPSSEQTATPNATATPQPTVPPAPTLDPADVAERIFLPHVQR